MGNTPGKSKKKKEKKEKKVKQTKKKEEPKEKAKSVGEIPEVKEGEDHNPFEDPRLHAVAEERPLYNLVNITHFDISTIRRLKKIFTEISQSKVDDGIIDSSELTAAMGLKEDSVIARTIFRLFDVTHTKRINFRTWVTTLSALSPKASLEDKIKFSFSLYDLNNDGMIDKPELHNLLIAAVRENVVSLTAQQVEEVVIHTLAKVDRDGNGTVDYQEYREMVIQSPKFLESFSLDVEKMCETYRRVRSKHSIHIQEDEAKKRERHFADRQEQAFTAMEREIGSSPRNEGLLAPPDKQTTGRKKTHAPSEKELDLDAKVVEFRRLSELFDPAELKAATSAFAASQPPTLASVSSPPQSPTTTTLPGPASSTVPTQST